MYSHWANYHMSVFLDISLCLCSLWYFSVLLVTISPLLCLSWCFSLPLSFMMFLMSSFSFLMILSDFVLMRILRPSDYCLSIFLWYYSVLLVFCKMADRSKDDRFLLDILYLNSSWAYQWQCSMIPGSLIFSDLLLYLGSYMTPMQSVLWSLLHKCSAIVLLLVFIFLHACLRPLSLSSMGLHLSYVLLWTVSSSHPSEDRQRSSWWFYQTSFRQQLNQQHN